MEEYSLQAVLTCEAWQGRRWIIKTKDPVQLFSYHRHVHSTAKRACHTPPTGVLIIMLTCLPNHETMTSQS